MQSKVWGPDWLAAIGDVWLQRRYRHGPRPVVETSNGGVRPAVVIAGGSRGIGFAFARRARLDGYHVVVVARTVADLDAAKSALVALKGVGDVVTVPLDLAEDDAPDHLRQTIADAGFFTDVLVVCAGIGASGPFARLTPERMQTVLAVNVAATAGLAREFLPGFLARRAGGILMLSSLGASVPGPNQALYYASKSFVTSLAKALAAEVSGYGVRVCCVMPGPVNTGFHSAMGADGAPYRWLLPQLTTDQVVDAALRGYALGARVVVPGIVNTGMYLALKIVPRRVSGWLVGLLLGFKRR